MLTALARFVMLGPWQAALVSAVFFLHPLTSWLGLATLSLVGLRYGLFQAGLIVLAVLVCQLLPFAVFQLIDGLAILVVLVAVQVLRTSLRLDWALVALSVTAAACLLVLTQMWPEVLAPLVDEFSQFYETLKGHWGESIPDSWQGDNIRRLVVEGLSLALAFKACAALLLGRWWQSVLYHPGGFSEDFLALRLSPHMVWVLSLSYVLLLFSTAEWVGLAQLIRIPLFLAGLGVAIWWFVEKKVASGWRVLFYISLIVIHPLVVVLGVVDSFVNIRARVRVPPAT